MIKISQKAEPCYETIKHPRFGDFKGYWVKIRVLKNSELLGYKSKFKPTWVYYVIIESNHPKVKEKPYIRRFTGKKAYTRALSLYITTLKNISIKS